MEVIEQAACQLVLEVSDASHAGEARRASVRCAERVGLNEAERGAVALAVTELATNLVKHAQSGKIICEAFAESGTQAIRILAFDKGPGIRDIPDALADGYSTAGTSGNGLGAVRRAANRFQIYSRPQRGTCILAEFWPRNTKPKASRTLQLGVISLPIRGEEVCGDGWMMKSNSETSRLMVVDGLGHGTFAAEAAREAQHVLAEATSASPGDILQDCHDALKKTRGAAAAIASIDRGKGTLSYAGLGNVSGVLASPNGTRGLASHNGTLGHHMQRVQEFAFPWSQDSVLIMHSDGLSARWDLEDYPGILTRDPVVLAAVLYRDFARERDDVTVLVAKNAEL